MVSQSTESTSLGAAYSYNGGGYGTWSQSGSFSSSVGTSKTWNADTNYKSYQRQMRYGRFQYCYSSTWGEWALYGTGGYGSTSIGYEYYSNCYPLDPGYWSRTSSSGNHYTDSVGVNIVGLLGINLSVDTNYDNSHTLTYYTGSYEHICGDNNVPAYSSNVNTKY
jgi:hypothetical protein